MSSWEVSTPVVSKVTTTNGTTYWYKDKDARDEIDRLRNQISGGVHWIGVTTTVLTDGATTRPIKINNVDYNQSNGDMVSSSPAGADTKEFIWTTLNDETGAGVWQELGSNTDIFGNFAYADTGTGADSAVTFNTSASGATVSAITGLPTATVPKTSSTKKYLTLSTEAANAITALPTATVPKPSGTTKYLTASASGAEVSTETAKAVTAMPTATVSKVTTTNTKKYLATTSVSPFGSAGTLPTFTSSVTNETLSFSFSQGTLPSAGTAVTVATGKVADSDTNGDQVVIGTGNSTSGTLSVSFGTPTTADFVTSASVSTQPSVTLTSASSTSTGAVSYISAVSTSGTNSVTFGTPTTASFLTSASLSSSSSTSTGAVDYISAVSTSGTNSVTFGTPTTADVLSATITATAAGQTVTPNPKT